MPLLGFVLPLSCILLIGSNPIHAKPEYFVAAMDFGAKDCKFCHANITGGEGLNDRGQWLVDERDAKKLTEIDVSWLESFSDEELDENIDAEEDDSVQKAETVTTQTGEIERVAEVERPFDFSTDFGEWPAYSGDIGAKKYSPLNQITQDNIDKLQIAWVWESELDPGVTNRRDASKAADMFKGSPLMVDGRLFIRTRYSTVAAIDALTGEPLWTYDPGAKDGPRPVMFGFTTRGLAFHKDEEGSRVLLVTSRGWLIALDAESGELIESFGEKGKVDLRKGLRRPLNPNRVSWSHAPNVCGDVVVIGSQPDDGSHSRSRLRANSNLPLGDVRGFDVKTGEQTWVFETVPQEGAFGNETWGKESWKWMGNTNVWSTTSCDPDLNIVYLPVTAPTSHFYGGERPGDNLFGTSLVAVDASTGERIWHFQNVRHDIWDYDNPAAPVVADVEIDGEPRKVVAQVTKTGYLFVFDRLTGKPIWKIEDAKVPESELEGEQPAATQPKPLWPPPFEMQGISNDDVIDFTPELKEQALEALARWNYGPLFSTPSLRGTLILPGIGGGANWGGASFDPLQRRLFVPSRRQPTLIRAYPVNESVRGFKYDAYFTFPDFSGLPFIKPPWSSITAYDLDTGEIAWSVPNGTGPKGHRLLRELELPDLGDIGAAPGLLVTPTALFYGTNNPGNRLRAMSKEDGTVLWEHPVLGTFSGAPPITYLLNGSQFVVIGTGATWEPVRLIAFSLPREEATNVDTSR